MKNSLYKLGLVSFLALTSLDASDVNGDYFGIGAISSDVTEDKKNTLNRNYYFGIDIGTSSMSVNNVDTINNNAVAKAESSGASSFGVSLGYIYDKEYFSQLSLNQISYDDVSFLNLLISYNKTFEQDTFTPYIGVVGGFTRTKFKKSYLENSTLNDDSVIQMALGVQGGVDYDLKNDMKLFAQYQFLKSKATTELQSGTETKKITRDNHGTLSCGIKWLF
jgi:opacity protein-like surface antigen